MEIVYKEQKKIIEKCKSFLIERRRKKIDIAISPLCFFTTWTESVGKTILYKFLRINKTKKIFLSLKNILSIGFYHDFTLCGSIDDNSLTNSNIIVSYCNLHDFDRSGFFYDKYFGVSSKKLKNTYWFLISLDHKTPKKLKNNILILKKKKPKSYSLIYFIKIFFRYLYKFNFSKEKLKNFIYGDFNYSELIGEFFYQSFKKRKIKSLLINYEGIPFQNMLMYKMKKINKNTKIYGYLHCAAWPLQTDLFYKKQPIDTLFVSGKDQQEVLIKFFLWKKKTIKVIPSLRFKKLKNKQFAGQIFVPFDLEKNNNYLEVFDRFIKNLPNRSINILKPRIHPLKKDSKIHIKFSNNLKKIIRLRRIKFDKKPQTTSVFIGSATGVSIQALEEGVNIIHIPSNKILDVFSNKIWKNIKVEKFQNEFFKYSLKNKNRLFIINNKKNNFNNFLKSAL